MMYIVYYVDDAHKEHMTFVNSIKDVLSLKDKFGEITVEALRK